MKIGICDDDKVYLEELEKYLEQWAVISGINMKLHAFFKGEQLLDHITAFGRYDLIFLDIEMSGMNGLQTAQEIRKKDYYTGLILMSQHNSYFQAGYEVQPFHFLTKPITQKRLVEIMNKYIRINNQQSEIICFKKGKINYCVNLSEVIYFTSERRHIYIIGIREEHIFYGKLDDIQKQLDKKQQRFLRIHQSFLVNMKYIKQYHYKSLVMSNGAILQISAGNRRSISQIHFMMLDMEL